MRSAKTFTAILLFTQFQHPGVASAQTVPGAYNVKLAWDASASTDVTGYRIHYGTASGAYSGSLTVGNVTAVTVPGLANGVTYFFAVTALDSETLESAYSNQVSFLPGLHETSLRSATGSETVLAIRGLIGQPYDIEATEDLKTWTLIETVTPGDGGSLYFSDPNAADYPKRFYRTRESQ